MDRPDIRGGCLQRQGVRAERFVQLTFCFERVVQELARRGVSEKNVRLAVKSSHQLCPTCRVFRLPSRCSHCNSCRRTQNGSRIVLAPLRSTARTASSAAAWRMACPLAVVANPTASACLRGTICSLGRCAMDTVASTRNTNTATSILASCTTSDM